MHKSINVLKAFLASFLLLFLCSFQCFADDIIMNFDAVNSFENETISDVLIEENDEKTEEEENIWTGEMYRTRRKVKAVNAVSNETADELMIADVITDDTYKYFLAQKGGDGKYYFMRFKEITKWNNAGNNIYTTYAEHKTTAFASKEEMFKAITTQEITTNIVTSTRGFVKNQIYACNFDIIDAKTNEIIEKTHSWKNGKYYYADDKDEEIDETEDTSLNIFKVVKNILNNIKKLPETIITGIKNLFIPSEQFMSEWNEKVSKKMSFTDAIKSSFETLMSYATSTEEAPVVYAEITYANTTQMYKVLDLSFLKNDIKTIRNVISAFCYLEFFWLLFKRVQEIIGGAGMITESQNQIELKETKLKERREREAKKREWEAKRKR